MSTLNELAVSEEEIAEVAGNVVSEVDEEALAPQESAPELDETVEVEESPFWDETPVVATESGDSEEVIASSEESDVSELDDGETITYTANGKEVTISKVEALKKLSLADGARKAFSDKAKLAKKAKNLDAENKRLTEYEKSWNKLENIKHDPEKLWEVITGEKHSDYLSREVERNQLYTEATPEEKQLMDYEARMRNIEREMKQDQKVREQELSTAKQANFDAEKKHVQSQLEREFYKHKLPEGNTQVTNKLSAMLWRNAIADLKGYQTKYGKMTPKMIQKAFKDNAAALKFYYKDSVDKGVSKITKKKKLAAKEKAQIASTRNYSDSTIDKEMVGKNPLDLFNVFKNKR